MDASEIYSKRLDRSGQPDETTMERGNRQILRFRNGYKNSGKIFVDDEIPLQGGSHASSFHEVSLQPTTKRGEDLGKHSVDTHFPKDQNWEVCKRTKITRAPCRRRNGEPAPRADKLGDLITADHADHKVLNERVESRINHRYAVVVQDHATQWMQSNPCKGVYESFSSRRKSLKILIQTIHLNLGQLVTICPGIILRYPIDLRRMVLLREWCAE